MKQRSYFWDNFKGILIVLVVFGHFIYKSAVNLQNCFVNDLFTFIYLFHMPAFVFCSGYLSKSENSCKAKSIVKLLSCYVVLNTLLMLYYRLYVGSEIQLLTPYASAWYILSLVIWRSTIKYTAKIKWLLPAAFATALLIGFWDEFSNVLALSRTVAFYPFFLLGYRTNEEKLQKHLATKTLLKMALGILAALIGSAGMFLILRRVQIPLAVLVMQPYTAGRHIIYRGAIMLCAVAAIAIMMYVVPDIKLPVLSKIGKNSLFIYLIHRFITFGFDVCFPYTAYSKMYLLYAALGTCATVIIFGTDRINNWFRNALNRISDGIVENKSGCGRRIVAVVLVIAEVILAAPLGSKLVNKLGGIQQEPSVDVVSTIDNTITISFVGDLLLLKDQVESAYDEETGEYNFDPVFQYAQKYLTEADLAIGVFEGPTAGEENGYTTSDYYDRAKLHNNFPDAFAEAVKNAGIDFVSLANNHLLDMGVDGALRTLDVLDAAGLAHTGAYRNAEEKEQIAIVEVEDVKIAVLAYSWAFNYASNEAILAEYPYVTSILPNENDAFFPQLMAEIEEDFAQAKAADADLVVVMPHMGTQFSHETDAFQAFWNKKFSELGADVILGDHAHAVQPIEQIGETIVVNCPGNFVNSFISYDGDATAIVEIYINKETKTPVASAIIPMYTQEMRSGYFRALPIYDVLTEKELYDQMANIDLERITQVQELITDVMLGEQIPASDVQPRYFYIDGKYQPYADTLLKNMSAYRDTELYGLLQTATKAVFIGDSITNGSHNNGHPWYQPIMSHFGNVTVQNISYPAYTTRDVNKNFADEILDSKGDLYVIAIGTNDVRYQDPKRCALTPQAYVEAVADMIDLILKSNQNAEIVLISPWMTLDNDRNSKLDHEEKLEAVELYSAALEEFAVERAYCFVNPNRMLLSFFETHQRFQYTSDGIHPNETKGIDLYSWAVMESSK